MREELLPFVDSTMTLVMFESPHRIDALLRALEASLGSRRVAICRELTKIHQQIYRVRLPDIPTVEQVPRKGEFTIVVEGHRRKASLAESDVVK
jgi:16S rRNA (cytidine1402-2'-O)-methyltransferase